VAGVEDSCEPYASLQGFYHDDVHIVVDNVTGLSEVNRIDHFVVAIVLVPIQIFGLTAMACPVSMLQRLLCLGGKI